MIKPNIQARKEKSKKNCCLLSHIVIQFQGASAKHPATDTQRMKNIARMGGMHKSRKFDYSKVLASAHVCIRHRY